MKLTHLTEAQKETHRRRKRMKKIERNDLQETELKTVKVLRVLSDPIMDRADERIFRVKIAYIHNKGKVETIRLPFTNYIEAERWVKRHKRGKKKFIELSFVKKKEVEEENKGIKDGLI